MTENRNEWCQSHADQAAVFVTLVGLLARLWTASGIFLNADEALHFRLANQVSLALAYKVSLSTAHPPLLILLLYFWRALGTSDLWLRLPSVLAGTAFCWIFYKWLTTTAGRLAALIGLLLVALLPPIVLLGAEVRQYALLLAFLAGALYFLDEAFAENSAGRMAAFSLCLYLAMLSHYSAFLFAAALGIYALIRIFAERSSLNLITAWTISQLGGLALAVFLYKTHLSKLGAGDSRTVLQGWMSEAYLHHSYFDPAHDNPLMFLASHTFGVFQYFFGQLAVGDVMGLLFLVEIAMLLRGKTLGKDQTSQRRLGLFLLLPFAIAGAASLAHVYPYGGTRHVAFLTIPAVAGVSLVVARLAAEKWARGLAITGLVVMACIAFGKPRRPMMDRADQSRTQMAAAIEFLNQTVLKQNGEASPLIFTDYESDLILGHYLCQQKPIPFEASTQDFESFTCGPRIISTSYKATTHFTSNNFVSLWNHLVETYHLKPGDTVWVSQVGWESDLPEDLRRHFAEFQNLSVVSFGNNIRMFKMTVGQPMPAAPYSRFLSASRPHFPTAGSAPAPAT